jgi:hypothetical protein
MFLKDLYIACHVPRSNTNSCFLEYLCNVISTYAVHVNTLLKIKNPLNIFIRRYDFIY